MNDQVRPEPTDRRDVLIGRVVDGEATSQDWEEIRELAGDDQTVFAEIAELQELRRETIEYVEEAGDIASRVEFPSHLHPKVTPAGRMRFVGVWGGWAVAALVAVAWSIGLRPGDPLIVGDANSGTMTGNLGGAVATNASDALQQYLDLGKESGTVIGELPSGIVLEKQPLADGSGYEVLYIRPIIERTTVHNVFREVQTESGKSQIVPAALPKPARQPQSW
ncbi:MAG: hypothetical protein ED559_00135 [Phycisphaera sp.]|nr:MAG: hypothetical protein ED559_00135 [Phycisphaera sp.]